MSCRSPRIFPVVAAFALAGALLSTSTARAADVAPPTIAISFDTQAIGMVNGWSTLTFTITNPNPGQDLSGVSFTDVLSDGIIFANPDSFVSSCGWDVNLLVHEIDLVETTIYAGSSCTIRYDVLGIASGAQTSTVTELTSAEGGDGVGATAGLFVALAPTTRADFGATSIPFGGTTTLTFTVTNPNPEPVGLDARPAAISEFFGSLSGIGFVDALPAGLVVADPNGLTGSCGGGSVTAVAGSGSVALADASLASGESCTFAVTVAGVSAGTKANSTGPVNSAEGADGDPGTGSVTVGAAPVTPSPVAPVTPSPVASVAPSPVAPVTPSPVVTPPSSSTVQGSGSGGAPIAPILLLMAVIGVAAAAATKRSADARSRM